MGLSLPFNDGEQPEIRTERLLLRPFSPHDARRLAALAGDRRIADTMISIPHPYSVAAAQDDIERFRAEWTAVRGVHFAICTNGEPSAFKGYIGVRDIETEHLVSELSFWLDAASTGKGYVTEAARAVLAFAFAAIGVNRVCAYHMVRNAASAGVLQRIGMHNEGCLRQRVRKWGAFEDVLVWAIVRSQWTDNAV